MSGSTLRLGRRGVLASGAVRSAQLPEADVARVDALAVELRRGNTSAVLRDLIHVALEARRPLARAVQALRDVQARAVVPIHDEPVLRVGWGHTDDGPEVRDLLALYADVVLGQTTAALRAPLDPAVVRQSVDAADAAEATQRVADVEAALRVDLGLPPAPTHAEACRTVALAVRTASAAPWLADADEGDHDEG